MSWPGSAPDQKPMRTGAVTIARGRMLALVAPIYAAIPCQQAR